MIYSGSRQRQRAFGRAVVAYVGRKLCRYRNNDVAEFFKSEPAVISQGTKKTENCVNGNEEFAKKLQMLERRLIWNLKY